MEKKAAGGYSQLAPYKDFISSSRYKSMLGRKHRFASLTLTLDLITYLDLGVQQLLSKQNNKINSLGL